jgi:hypothetical protein
LYKYRATPSDEKAMRSIRDILVNSKLWLSSPADFNDPFDMKAKIVVDSDVQERRKRWEEHFKAQGLSYNERKELVARLARKPVEEIEGIAQLKIQERSETTGVCSFGGDPLSILMWSHYASNHQGICLQFDIVRDPKNLIFALPVDYSDEFPVINWTNFADFKRGMSDTLLRKHPGWKYEGERRIIALERTRIPYPFLPEALTAVILGCRAIEEPILGLLDERRKTGLAEPKLYRAFQHDRKYRLNLKRIS